VSSRTVVSSHFLDYRQTVRCFQELTFARPRSRIVSKTLRLVGLWNLRKIYMIKLTLTILRRELGPAFVWVQGHSLEPSLS
jgi:hypothetical protein